ncbi:hypothetical protein PTSG_01893 [Salpingoeca rosetta]|uniref:Small ribosomal subunit protein mS33 n=1 Tax=Salpingoeca rosetta (strain ATCC 50818 / BSB-021) TaxID=946362 RepID=F2TZ94_SALR5|nr:uncharacterized protein PTSG_01893 [Salpingoeca rosetta]EGD78918.1 hypothetical protein PTSG_01893 [Salpingoeca rosetta]|eukprot:XP_004997874.1 hypothetical protein PTSG_01893 [Salpingoeca rosetta]
MAERLRRLGMLSRSIFGQVVLPPNVRSPTRHLKKATKAEAMMRYYPETVMHQNKLLTRMIAAGIYLDEKMIYEGEKKVMNEKRGRVPTRKGEGKRAQKKKKK